jgi:hypothetical protein
LFKVFCWCLLSSAFKEHEVAGIKLGIGQFVTGRYVAAEECGMPGNTVINKLKRLQEFGTIKLETIQVPKQRNKRVTLVTICNFERYQNKGKDWWKSWAQQNKDSINNKPLILCDDTPVRKQKPRKKQPPHPETMPLLDCFKSRFKVRFGIPYLLNWGKDGAHIKRLLDGGLTFKLIVDAMDRFFKDDSEFLRKAGYTIGVFAARINSYAMPDEKEKPTHLDLRIEDEYDWEGKNARHNLDGKDSQLA